MFSSKYAPNKSRLSRVDVGYQLAEQRLRTETSFLLALIVEARPEHRAKPQRPKPDCLYAQHIGLLTSSSPPQQVGDEPDKFGWLREISA